MLPFSQGCFFCYCSPLCILYPIHSGQYCREPTAVPIPNHLLYATHSYAPDAQHDFSPRHGGHPCSGM